MPLTWGSMARDFVNRVRECRTREDLELVRREVLAFDFRYGERNIRSCIESMPEPDRSRLMALL